MWACLASSALAFQDIKPRVRAINVTKISLVENDSSKATVVFEITGEGFGKTKPEVRLLNQDTGAAVDATVTDNDDSKIIANSTVPVAKKASKYVFKVKVGAEENIIPLDHRSDFTLEFSKDQLKEDNKPKPIEITFETFKSEQYPNLYSVLVTNKNQNIETGFSPNPSLMKVDIVPAGATNVTVQPGSSPYQMLVTFLAPEKFEVKGLVVTVFDPNSMMGSNRPVAYSTPFKEKPAKADPNQHAITNVEVLSLQRRSGFGRLKIEGSGFGDYERPPFPGEMELLCCLKRPADADKTPEREDEAGTTSEVCRLTAAASQCQAMRNWRDRIEERVNLIITPRNPDLRVERTEILYIDDKTIDVYFEFSHFAGHSQPFRLANVTVTVNKGAVQATQISDTNDKKEVVSAVLSGPKTYVARGDVGPPRDKNLEYRYALIDDKDARRLFGRGVGTNFYVIELSVVNNGKKKVAIPLGSIQAEAEWSSGFTSNENIYYDEGPPTLPALPLGAVSGYFDAFQKAEGWRARTFNILGGVSVLANSLIPVFGRNIERPNSILSTGFIPGLQRAVGDLSSEQLQRLTTMSWENVEEVPPGGSKTKFIYIPRADFDFGEKKVSAKFKALTRRESDELRIKRRIVSITGLEVSGFEVIETEQRLATPQP